ncbi:uncharacterized protein LOC142985515 [Anticarsia gemmatalis]|uniref:uncharacterized protein LOC142985515 n=1 Tax=Anticarsia gemmatalis TaxID=129554 RepID=UPI003F75C35C
MLVRVLIIIYGIFMTTEADQESKMGLNRHYKMAEEPILQPVTKDLNTNSQNKQPKNGNNKQISENFTKFLKALINILTKYPDADLKHFFIIFNEEARKFDYTGCKFNELSDLTGLAEVMDHRLYRLQDLPPNGIRNFLARVTNRLTESHKDNERNMIRYINFIYSLLPVEKYNIVLGNLDKYRVGAKNNAVLRLIVRKGLRSLVFDYYSVLIDETRLHLKDTLYKYWNNLIVNHKQVKGSNHRQNKQDTDENKNGDSENNTKQLIEKASSNLRENTEEMIKKPSIYAEKNLTDKNVPSLQRAKGNFAHITGMHGRMLERDGNMKTTVIRPGPMFVRDRVTPNVVRIHGNSQNYKNEDNFKKVTLKHSRDIFQTTPVKDISTTEKKLLRELEADENIPNLERHTTSSVEEITTKTNMADEKYIVLNQTMIGITVFNQIQRLVSEIKVLKNQIQNDSEIIRDLEHKLHDMVKQRIDFEKHFNARNLEENNKKTEDFELKQKYGTRELEPKRGDKYYDENEEGQLNKNIRDKKELIIANADKIMKQNDGLKFVDYDLNRNNKKKMAIEPSYHRNRRNPTLEKNSEHDLPSLRGKYRNFEHGGGEFYKKPEPNPGAPDYDYGRNMGTNLDEQQYEMTTPLNIYQDDFLTTANKPPAEPVNRFTNRDMYADDYFETTSFRRSLGKINRNGRRRMGNNENRNVDYNAGVVPTRNENIDNLATPARPLASATNLYDYDQMAEMQPEEEPVDADLANYYNNIKPRYDNDPEQRYVPQNPRRQMNLVPEPPKDGEPL